MTTDSNRGNDPRDTAAVVVRRKRRQSKRLNKRKQRSWAWLLELVALILFASGWVILLRISPVAEWLGAWDVTLVMGLTILLVSSSVLFSRLRTRVNARAAWWASYGCPKCQHPYLKRQHSFAWHRLARQVGIPARRYICTNCYWSGTRINDTHMS